MKPHFSNEVQMKFTNIICFPLLITDVGTNLFIYMFFVAKNTFILLLLKPWQCVLACNQLRGTIWLLFRMPSPVPEPQLDTFVFCKTKSDVGAFQLDDIGEEVVDLVADDLYVLRYKSIKGLVEAGRIDLIWCKQQDTTEALNRSSTLRARIF